MERGPLALFGAIVAVGVGPALWMGVQLGAVQGNSPARPPVVREQDAFTWERADRVEALQGAVLPATHVIDLVQGLPAQQVES